MLGFGAHSKIHTSKVLRLSEDLPIVVEIVDTEENIEKLMPFLDEVIREGLMTKEVANVVFYRPDGQAKQGS
jgi:PII-like signaling protein